MEEGFKGLKALNDKSVLSGLLALSPGGPWASELLEPKISVQTDSSLWAGQDQLHRPGCYCLTAASCWSLLHTHCFGKGQLMLGAFNCLLSAQKEITVLNRARQKSSFSGFLKAFFKEMCALIKLMNEQRKDNSSDMFIGEGDPGSHRSTSNASK